MEIAQYIIILVNLDPTIGSEIKKTRPCVIISPDELNRNLKTVVIAPMTTNLIDYPTRVKVIHSGKEGRIALDQIWTIDKKRIVKVSGKISRKEVLKVKSIISKTYVQ